MKRSLLPLTFLILLSISSKLCWAGYEMSFKEGEAMKMIFSLRNESAERILNEAWRSNPDNYIIPYLLHYNDAVRLIILDNESLYEKFKEDYDHRRDVMEKAGEDSPYYHWLEAEMLFHLGLAQLKFGTKISGASKVFSAYKIIKENQEKYPDFWQDDKLAAIFDMIFANIPPVIRWAARMIGIKGDMERGFESLKAYQEKAMDHPGLAEESILLLNLAYKMQWKEEEGLQFMKGLDQEMFQTILVGYMYANLASFSGHNETSLQVLASIDREAMEIPFFAMDYLAGRCYLNRLDDRAEKYLRKYLEDYPGQDYKKDACNRLSWFYLVKGDMDKFSKYKAEVENVGEDLRDRDREAIVESRIDYTPHPELLKSRLLFDGGYNELAWEHLGNLTGEDLAFLPYALEYHYRKGRLYYRSGEMPRSIAEMEWVIEHGNDEPYTFATRAALHLGTFYEEQGSTEKAVEYYELCNDLYDSDHSAEGIENKAEMGLKRLK